MFDPASIQNAIIGGFLIGFASVLLMAFNGRIAGISGIAGALLIPQSDEKGWRAAFVIGLIISPFIWPLLGGTLPPVEVPHSLPVVLLGGLFVGYGTRLGSGCTSGHGVCGMSRLSKRSITATLTFMATGFATVFIFRHVIGG